MKQVIKRDSWGWATERLGMRRLLAFVAFAQLWLTGANLAQADAPSEFFERSVRPLLISRCGECHGPSGKPAGNLRLTDRASLLQGGDRGPAIVPGQPESSLLWHAVRRSPELAMPPKGSLSKAEIDILTRWIQEGSVWPDLKTGTSPNSTDTPGAPWAFQPLREPPLPTSARLASAARPLDLFVDQKRQERGLAPSSKADPATWLRRLYYDLVGLPPTPAEVEQFSQDPRDDARDRYVDRLLASPRYAERWGRRWLDVVRYAETNGFEDDIEKPNAYRYRDYVIDAFNTDLPYDQFVREQIAGDLLDQPRVSPDGQLVISPVGSGFWWLGEIMPLPFCVEDARKIAANEVETQIDTYGKAFLGLTLSCARCHDHKFDPIPTEDYAAIAGALQSTTNVQQSIETTPFRHHNEEARRRLEEIDRRLRDFHARPAVARQIHQQRIERARQIADSLLGANVTTLILPGPSSSPVDPGRLARWLAPLLSAVGSKHPILYPWSRLQEVDNDAYARRAESLTSYLKLVRSQLPAPLSPDAILGDFEASDFGSWRASGEAFGEAPTRWDQTTTAGTLGQRLASTARNADTLTGRLVSPPFVVTEDKRYLYFLLAGGDFPGKTCVNVVLHSQAMPQRPPFWTYAGSGDRVLRQRWFDLQYYMNMEVFIEVVDASSEPGGHISVDHFYFSPRAPDPGEFAFVHPLVLDALAGARSKEEFARRLQDLFVQALTRPVTGDNSPTEQPWNTLRQWLTGDDSPLLTLEEAEQLLAPAEQSESRNLRAERAQVSALCRPSDLAMISRDRRRPADALLQPGGEVDPTGPTIPRGVPARLLATRPTAPVQGSGRRELADWTVGPARPLLARVLVNRVWAGHFRKGIVPSPDNFGALGEPPTHPELLDYLASRFVEEGWSIKGLHREMTLSATYGLDSRPVPASAEIDPANHLLHSMPVRRLEAEAIRDSILSLSGALEDRFGGPSTPLSIELNVQLNPVDTPGVQLQDRCRSIYLQVRRNHVPTLLEAFDFPNRPETVGERSESALPVQALDLLNSEFLAVSSQRWAEQALSPSAPADPSGRIEYLYRHAFCRAPDSRETQTALAFLDRQRTTYARMVPTQEADQRAWQDLCHVLLNVSEFIYVR